MSDHIKIERLSPTDAPMIVSCFDQAYRGSYGNRLFADESQLADAIVSGALCSVGARTATGEVIAHMAMTINEVGGTPELGNTVVLPAARGGGLAWQVGDELIRWCEELGNTGFLHYPTTDHHIMQQQSLKNGFETGLMLSYIPSETDGQVNSGTEGRAGLRGAVTVVYQPLAAGDAVTMICPAELESIIGQLARDCGLSRTFITDTASGNGISVTSLTVDEVRQLSRLTVTYSGHDIAEQLPRFISQPQPCLQLDLCTDDVAMPATYALAREFGFVFSAWLPGYRQTDVIRLQKIDLSVTSLEPVLVGETAQQLLTRIRVDLAGG